MPLYVYEKAIPQAPTQDPPPKTTKQRIVHLVPISISLIGLVLIGFVLWPILSYELGSSHSSALTSSGLLNPQVDLNTTAIAAAPQVVQTADFTKANNWFPTSISNTESNATQYYLTIPKLRIENAVVRSDTLDLAKNLVHYPDTALPGQLGSPVIFGHSILPQFYNPQNYMSIFSLLPSLTAGDLIYISFDKVTYTYQVTDKKEVYPTDLTPLQQQFDDKRLKLVTCVPPGLKTKRLIVSARLLKT